MAANHNHERGAVLYYPYPDVASQWNCVTDGCFRQESAEWWAAYEQCQRDIEANGLQGHEERIERITINDLIIPRVAVAAYLAPLLSKEE
jgi:hypothetical protein